MTKDNKRFFNIGSIKPLIKLMIEAKIPWISYLFFFILNIFVTERSVRLTVISGQFFDPTYAEQAIHDSALIWEFALSTFAIALIGFLTIPMSWVSINFQKRAQLISWKKILRLPLSTVNYLDPSSLVSRVSTDASFITEVLANVLNFFRNGYWLYLAIITLFNTDTWLAKRIVPTVLLSVVITMFASRFIYKIHYKLQQVESKLTAFLNERLSALRTIKSEQTESLEIKRGMEVNKEKFHAEVNRVTYDTFYTGYQSLITIILQIIVIISGAIRVSNGDMPLGSLVTIFFLSHQFPGTTQSFFSCILTMIRIQGQTQVVSELTQFESEPYNLGRKLEKADMESNLIFDNVNFSYDNKTNILKDLNANLLTGKTNAIVGPSGAGKTTILKLIERFYTVNDGEIKFADKNINSFDIASYRKDISYIIQNSPLMPGTILDNILYGLRDKHADINTTEITPKLQEKLDEVIKIAQLDEVISKLPDGLNTDVGDLADKISGGQRQRIAIARALISDPKILLMDEATANIDSENENKITEAIFSSRQNKTTIIVAHQLSTILGADQIILMDQGTIKASGTHDELYSKNNLYKELFDLQQLV